MRRCLVNGELSVESIACAKQEYEYHKVKSKANSPFVNPSKINYDFRTFGSILNHAQKKLLFQAGTGIQFNQ